MVATKIFMASKDFPKMMENQEKENGKDQAMWDVKTYGNKDSKPNGGKKKDRIRFKG